MKLEINDDERAILLEMLKKAEAALPIEIHHCSRTNDFKDFLKEQLVKIEALVKKFE